jgi:membrane complex biogenesis BtpA family protein
MKKLNFSVTKPIIGMVHLNPYKSGKRFLDDALKDIKSLADGGIDGLLYENWSGLYIGETPMRDTREYIATVIKEASKVYDLPYGINVLPLDYRAAFDIAKATGAAFVQVDTFVDELIDLSHTYKLETSSKSVMRYKASLGLGDLALFTNIQSKHYHTLPPNKKLETSALQAIKNGSDAIVVTGRLTGLETPKEKLLRVNKVCGETPVFIGSGLSERNVRRLLPYADGAIVGTSLKEGGVTDNAVDEKRVRRLMRIVNSLR